MTIVHEGNISLQQPLNSQEEASKSLAKQTFCSGIALDKKEIYQRLLEREKEGTIGIISGFAIPHAKSQTINEPSTIAATLNKGIEWNSLDRQSAGFISALFIPDLGAGTAHLRLLPLVARSLMRREITKQLKKAELKTEIATILTKKIDEDL